MFEHSIDNNLSIQMLREENAEELFSVVDANRQRLREWLPWLDANTKVEHTLEFIQSTLKQHSRDEGFVCAIFFKGRVSGVVGYHPIKKANKSVDIGYWLSSEATGKGIMTKCCRALIDYAFSELDLNRVSIPAAVGNARSRAIPERLGFMQEGIIHDAEWLYDHYVDNVLYAMLKRDWNGEQVQVRDMA